MCLTRVTWMMKLYIMLVSLILAIKMWFKVIPFFRRGGKWQWSADPGEAWSCSFFKRYEFLNFDWIVIIWGGWVVPFWILRVEGRTENSRGLASRD